MSAGDIQAYSPPLSLWRLVEQHVSPEEQEEIRSMLGTSLIETTLDLHNEVDMLLEIWQNYQDETDSEAPKIQMLAEPPHIRERLIQEICFLAEGVREKSVRKGMNPSALFTGHNSQILEYAEEVKRSGSSLGTARPMSARSIDGRQTPISPSGLATSRSMLSETIHDDVSSANDKLNYLQFDQVCSRLRATLAKEIEQLEADVLFLQGCLDDAADVRSHAATPALSREPTLTELREERTLLEKELLSAERLPSTPSTSSVNKPAFLAKPAAAAAVKVPNLNPVKTRLRATASSTSDRGSTKTAPLKAFHHFNPTSPSPDHMSHSPDSAATSSDGASSPSNLSVNSRVIAQMYNLNVDHNTQDSRPQSHTSVDKDSDSGFKEDGIRRREGSGGSSRRRSLSPARVKVVPVGSITGTRPFIPTPPAAEKPQLPRPSSAERFRKMVMHYRETT